MIIPTVPGTVDFCFEGPTGITPLNSIGRLDRAVALFACRLKTPSGIGTRTILWSQQRDQQIQVLPAQTCNEKVMGRRIAGIFVNQSVINDSEHQRHSIGLLATTYMDPNASMNPIQSRLLSGT